MVKNSHMLIEIDDINRDLIGKNTDLDRINTKCKLASLYRLVDMLGMSQSIYNHITLRLNENEFLINPFGLLYEEITASSLKTIDSNGNVIKEDNNRFSVNKAGFVLHSAIHSAREDAKCIIHVHCSSIIAVANFKYGLLNISQEAMILGNVSYHDYNGILIDFAEQESLIKDLGSYNKIMFLKNHGAIVLGETVEEAFYWLFHLNLACKNQVKTLSMCRNDYTCSSKEISQKVHDVVKEGYSMVSLENNHRWSIGELEFTAFMRKLDRKGLNTGYPYRNAD